MDEVDNILDFVEGRLMPSDFAEIVYSDRNMEEILNTANPIPPYTSRSGELYNFVIQTDFSNIENLINLQDALSKFLRQNSVPNNISPKLLDDFKLLLKVQPKWLNIPSGYFLSLLAEAGDKKGKVLEDWLKSTITDKFKCLSKQPKWLQSPSWPIVDGVPLIFVGQLDVSVFYHDTSNVYIFFNQRNDSYTTIVQNT
jgi:hypothetical protein